METLDLAEYGDYPVYNDLKVTIDFDPDPLNPRTEFDNLGTFAMYHKNCDYGDEKEFSEPKDLMKFLKEENCEFLPVYMIDHGGIGFSTSSYNDSWDSGQVGVIYITPDDIVKNFGKDTPETRELARKCLRHEIETVNAYASGEVYGFEVKTPFGIYDSCWGFYGQEGKEDCIKEALSSYDDLCKNFATPEATRNFIKENKENYNHIPMECRTLEASKQYIKAGGDIKSVPSKHIKSVTLKDDTSLKM